MSAAPCISLIPSSLRLVTFSSWLAVLVLAFGQAGCSTGPTPHTTTAARNASEVTNPFATLRVGEKSEALRARLGAPAEIKPMPHEAVASEVWVYRRALPATTTQVASSIEYTHAVDPLTGNALRVPQAKYETVVIDSDEIIRLLLINGELKAWTTARESKHGFK